MDRALPDVVLVVFDTARRDRFGCYGSARPTTPTVDSLASAGLLAETMLTTAPWTLPSHASLFTGLYPSEHGAQWQSGRQLSAAVDLTIGEWFRGLGYETICATNNGLISFETGLARGFDRHVHRRQLEQGLREKVRQMKKVAMGGDSGGEVINRWLEAQVPSIRRPMFLFVNYLECHWPYAPPRRLYREVGGPRFGLADEARFRAGLARRVGPWDAVGTADPRTLDVYSALFDAEHRNVDGHLEHLLDVLEKAGRLGDGDALVIVTSDHGEHLGEHGLADHQASLDDHLIHVPFVAWGPGVVGSERLNRTFEFVDVLPSLARLLDRELDVPALAAKRASLFARTPDETRGPNADLGFAEWRSWGDVDLRRVSGRNPRYDFSGLARDLLRVRGDRFSLVRFGDGREVLVDHVGDPLQEADVSAEQPNELARLGAALDGKLAEWRAGAVAPAEVSDADVDEIERHLSELGYI